MTSPAPLRRLSPCLCARSHRPAVQPPLSSPAPSPLVDDSLALASSAPVRSVCRAGAPSARASAPIVLSSLSLPPRLPSLRCCPRASSFRATAVAGPRAVAARQRLPLSRERSICPRRAPSALAPHAPLPSPRHHVCCSTPHRRNCISRCRAATQNLVALPRWRRRCRPRRRRGSVTLASTRSLRRRTPRAEPARSLRACAAAVTPPRRSTPCFCAVHSCASAGDPVDLPRRCQRCTPHHRRASTPLAFSRAQHRSASRAGRARLSRSAAAIAPPASRSVLCLCTYSTPSPRRYPRSRRPSAPLLPLPPATSLHAGHSRLLASSAPAHVARRARAPLTCLCYHRDITAPPDLTSLRRPTPLLCPRSCLPSAPTPPSPPSPQPPPSRVGGSRLIARSAPPRTARRASAPRSRCRHARDTTSPLDPVLLCHPLLLLCLRSRGRSVPTPPPSPTPSPCIDCPRLFVSSAPARAARRASAPPSRV